MQQGITLLHIFRTRLFPSGNSLPAPSPPPTRRCIKRELIASILRQRLLRLLCVFSVHAFFRTRFCGSVNSRKRVLRFEPAKAVPGLYEFLRRLLEDASALVKSLLATGFLISGQTGINTQAVPNLSPAPLTAWVSPHSVF